MKTHIARFSAWLTLGVVLACDRSDAAPQDLHSGKTPTGTIDPGPGAPSRERAASPSEQAGGMAGVGGTAGGGTPGSGGAAAMSGTAPIGGRL